jgi:ribosomal protein S7
MSDKPIPPGLPAAELTAAQLAWLLDVSPRRLEQLTASGVIEHATRADADDVERVLAGDLTDNAARRAAALMQRQRA